MSVSIEWTDATGSASLTNAQPNPGWRLGDWTPRDASIGPTSVALATGRINGAKFRRDGLVSFEMRNVPRTNLPLMLRLKLHLMKGGLITLTDDNVLAERWYISTLAPGTVPAITFADDVMLEYTFGVVLREITADTPGSIYVRTGWYITVQITFAECSGGPESVAVRGALSGIMFTGSDPYNSAINGLPNLIGQTKTFGPVASTGVLTFFAAHQVYALSFPGRVTWTTPGGPYTVALEDGFGDLDYNDVVLLVTVYTGAPGAVNTLLPFPPNDMFAGRITISGSTGTVSGYNYTSGTEPGEPVGNSQGNTIWYQWTAPSNSPIRFHTNATVSITDTTLGIYTGNAVNALTQVAYDDDSGTGSLSDLTFTPVSGTVYKIQIGTYQSLQEGAIVLTWLAPYTPSPPANDNFAARQAITGASGSASGTLTDATLQASEPNTSGMDQSVWYSWTAPAAGVVTFSASGAGLPYVYMGFYTGTVMTSLTEILTSYDSFSVTVTSGTVYTVQLLTNSGDGTGPFSLTWSLV